MRQRVCVEIRNKSRLSLFLEFFFFTLFVAVIALIFAPVAGLLLLLPVAPIGGLVFMFSSKDRYVGELEGLCPYCSALISQGLYQWSQLDGEVIKEPLGIDCPVCGQRMIYRQGFLYSLKDLDDE